MDMVRTISVEHGLVVRVALDNNVEEESSLSAARVCGTGRTAHEVSDCGQTGSEVHSFAAGSSISGG